jgi:SAM-dependent methyltransferase
MEGHGNHAAPRAASVWDERYKLHTHQASANEPNQVLAAELDGRRPGRALDVGCGVGADAIWLAAKGWQVTATDISEVALDRAARAAIDRGVTVAWVRGPFEATIVEPAAFDLVVTLYPALRHDGDGSLVAALIGAVAPGGTLLVVDHATPDPDAARSHGFDPAAFVQPKDVAARLDDGWQVDVDETRERTTDRSHGATHARDTVLRATRRGGRQPGRCPRRRASHPRKIGRLTNDPPI